MMCSPRQNPSSFLTAQSLGFIRSVFMVFCWYLHSFTSLHHFIVFYCFCDWAPSGLLFVGWDSLLMMEVRQPHWLQRWWFKKLSDKPTVSFSIFLNFSCLILRQKQVFLSPLNFDSEIYNSNKENSIPCFLVMKLDDEAAVFSAYLGQNWMTSFHTIFSLSYSVRFLSVKQTIPNRNRWVQTPKSQGMAPLKLELWEGDSTRVNLIVMVRLANVTVTSTTLVRLTSCWGCQLWYQSKFESVWHQFSPKTFN